MEAIKHGVYAERLAAQTTSTTSVTSGIPVYVGTAPVHMTKEPAVNTPVLCTSKDDCLEKIGYQSDFKNYSLCQAIYARRFRRCDCSGNFYQCFGPSCSQEKNGRPYGTGCKSCSHDSKPQLDYNDHESNSGWSGVSQ